MNKIASDRSKKVRKVCLLLASLNLVRLSSGADQTYCIAVQLRDRPVGDAYEY